MLIRNEIRLIEIFLFLQFSIPQCLNVTADINKELIDNLQSKTRTVMFIKTINNKE